MSRYETFINFVKSNWSFATIVISGVACAALVAFVVIISSERPLTPLEATLLQVVILSTGLIASFLSSQKVAKKATKPHVRSAFRRVKSLYFGLFYLKSVIDEHKQSKVKSISQTVQVVEAVVDQQVSTVIDAMEDWREINPKDVDDLEEQLRHSKRIETEDLRR